MITHLQDTVTLNNGVKMPGLDLVYTRSRMAILSFTPYHRH